MTNEEVKMAWWNLKNNKALGKCTSILIEEDGKPRMEH